MIIFELDGDVAIIYNDVDSNNGWLITYDCPTKKFHVYDQLNRYELEMPPVEVDTLEQALALVTYT